MPGVFLFVQNGCPACHEYMPRFEHVVAPIRRTVPVGVYDLAQGGHVAEFGEKLKVSATPTTIVLDRNGRLHRKVGALGVRDLEALLRTL